MPPRPSTRRYEVSDRRFIEFRDTLACLEGRSSEFSGIVSTILPVWVAFYISLNASCTLHAWNLVMRVMGVMSPRR
ncbi:uncharacterized protein BDV14DRAFT_177812 [Aspergillus stella-maris]|uniref:uncharacterized protein n=1 Tax=Aspergillus stella-maris TaxID=1810926 RepID=UPI003CCDF939